MNVGVLEAKNRLSELLDRAVAGEEVVITRRGEPQVTLSPIRRKVSQQEVERLIRTAAVLRTSYVGPPSSAATNREDRDADRRF